MCDSIFLATLFEILEVDNKYAEIAKHDLINSNFPTMDKTFPFKRTIGNQVV